MEQILIIIGVSLFGVLGTIHLVYTFSTEKFNPYDASAAEAMKRTSPQLTKETTIWRAWIGFNASHSLGVMLFAAIYIPLAINNFEVIESSLWFSLLPVVVSASYLILAKKYWFKIPFVGFLVSLVCFLFSAWLIHT
ncbi:LIC_13387 family protein [Pseudoalteromonas piscicida]|uniref:LIC_13387 family protein n=1 Tax=Pseudoalteromonas piscicida TaxID=43662 RepID=UPI0030968C76